MAISITGNNEIRFMFTIKRNIKNEKRINIIFIKQKNKQTKLRHK